MDAFLRAMTLVSDPVVLLTILGSSLFGMMVGCIPGLTATMATVLLVPFAIVMPGLMAQQVTFSLPQPLQTWVALASCLPPTGRIFVVQPGQRWVVTVFFASGTVALNDLSTTTVWTFWHFGQDMLTMSPGFPRAQLTLPRRARSLGA